MKGSRQTALLAGVPLGLEPVHKVDDVEEASAGALADQRPGNGNGEVGLARTGPADEDNIALVGDEATVRGRGPALR